MIGYVLVGVLALMVLRLPIEKLLLSGAITGVVIGIAPGGGRDNRWNRLRVLPVRLCSGPVRGHIWAYHRRRSDLHAGEGRVAKAGEWPTVIMVPMSTAAALPRVEGQHRNKALAAARRARAVELVTQGMTYQQVADELGYANRGTVYRIVHQTLARDTTEAVGTLQELEVARLDALQAALWDQAMDGDVAAARTAMRIVIARCRLLGLHDLTPPERFVPRTVFLTAEDRAALGL
jgi:transposase-like protein